VRPDDVQSATDVMSVATTACGDEEIDGVPVDVPSPPRITERVLRRTPAPRAESLLSAMGVPLGVP
jgi:hypothetical protein